MSALDEIEFPGLEASELQAFLGRRGVFAICVRRFYVEARGHGLPGAQWATRNEIAAAPEVVVEVWRYRNRSTFSKRRSFSAWAIDARRVLRACRFEPSLISALESAWLLGGAEALHVAACAVVGIDPYNAGREEQDFWRRALLRPSPRSEEA